MFSKEQTTIDPMIPDSIKPIIIQSKHHHNQATSLILWLKMDKLKMKLKEQWEKWKIQD